LRGETVAATALRLGGVIEPLGHVRRDLPAALCAALDRALAPDAARRGTLAQLRGALEAAHAQASAPSRTHRRGAQRPKLSLPLLPANTIALTPRARSLAGAAAAGTLSGAALTAVLGVHSVAAAVIAGAGAAMLVSLSAAVGWLLIGLVALGWLGAGGHPGTALVLAAALVPVPVLLASRPWLWSAPALGVAFGALGVAACAPVLAARLGSRPSARAALGALSYWWLVIVEVLTGRRLLFGAPPGAHPRSSWENSLTGAAQHALAPLWSDGRLATAVLWAAAAVALPLLVRGSRLRSRSIGALAWAGLFVAGGALEASKLGLPSSPAPALVGLLAGALALVGAGATDRSHQPPTVA
jgi:hypothetical protein